MTRAWFELGARSLDPLRLLTVADGLDHPEAVCWSPHRHVLYAGGEDGQLYEIDEAGRLRIIIHLTGSKLLGLALDSGGAIYACDPVGHCVRRISTETGAVSQHGPEMEFPNYPVFDRSGNLWVSDSGSWERPTGRLLRIDPSGCCDQLAIPPIHYANGLAIKGERLFVVESVSGRILQVRSGGRGLEEVVRLKRAIPDGIAFDAEGSLWIGCYQPNRVYRLRENGRLTTELSDWTGEYVLSPTNLAFAGPGLDMLVLASLCGRSVKALRPSVRGAPLELPKLEQAPPQAIRRA